MLALEHSFELDPQVAMRPEPFGALAYHYGNRRLVFIRCALVPVVEALPRSDRLEAALEAAGVPHERWDAHRRALGSLEQAGILRRRVA